jgi:pantoate--beta-alanine ligase
MRIVPTVREPDGLAMSSRNCNLDPEQRRNAPALWRALEKAKGQIGAGERDPDAIENMLLADLAQIPGVRVDFAKVVEVVTLRKPPRLAGQILIALAVFFGTTRLIDNIQVDIT